MKRVFLFLVLIIVVLTGAQARKQYVLNSEHIAKPDTVWVFTPASFKADNPMNYPVIYLLHGWSGTYHQWDDIMDCQSYADKYGFIIVCPDGLYDSWYINSPGVKESRFADFFFLDLMPFVAKQYPVDIRNVFITGLSMGGHGALYLFEQKPDLFLSAGSLSGVLDLSDYLDSYQISKYLGVKDKSADKNTIAAYSVSGNIDKIAKAGKQILITCGSSDPFYKINNDFKMECDELKIAATYISSPGAHDYPYWKSAIGYHFDFFSKQLVH